MQYLYHLHKYTNLYKWLLPLITLLCFGAIIFSCLWDSTYAWTLVVAAVILLLIVVPQWFLLLWGVISIHYPTQHGIIGTYSSDKVRLYSSIVEQGSVKVLEISYSEDEITGDFVTDSTVWKCIVEALAPTLIQLKWGLWIFHLIVTNVVRAEDVQQLYESLPLHYQHELEAFAEAIHIYLPANSFLTRWTVLDWFAIQMIPDLELFLSAANPCTNFLKIVLQSGNERRVRVSGGMGVGCTALMTPEGFYRNMDWPSLGLMGTFTLLVRKTYPNGVVSLEVGVPGLLGTVTAVISWPNNESTKAGTCVRGMLAMNVCCPHERVKWLEPGQTYLPASYVNRQVLHELALHGPNVLNNHNLSVLIGGATPIGPYHISFGRFVDEQLSGVMCHCCQDGNNGHVFRSFPAKDATYLLTCNGNFTERAEESTSCYKVYAHDLMHTNARTDLITKDVQQGCTNGKQMLNKFPVNNHETCYFVALEEHRIELRVNNAFGAASEPIDITSILVN